MSQWQSRCVHYLSLSLSHKLSLRSSLLMMKWSSPVNREPVRRVSRKSITRLRVCGKFGEAGIGKGRPRPRRRRDWVHSRINDNISMVIVASGFMARSAFFSAPMKVWHCTALRALPFLRVLVRATAFLRAVGATTSRSTDCSSSSSSKYGQ